MNQSQNSGGYIFTVNMNSLQIILPISMLSFLFSQSPGFDGLLDFLQIYGFDSTSTVSNRAKRAYAFFLFNGLLALLINSSGASKSSLKTAMEDIQDGDDIVTEKILSVDQGNCKESDDDVIIADHVIAEQVSTRDREECEETEEYDGCDTDTNDLLSDDEEDVEDDRCDDLVLSDYESDDEEETEEVVVWGISVEELNSKCDDFIKNMRHGLAV